MLVGGVSFSHAADHHIRHDLYIRLIADTASCWWTLILKADVYIETRVVVRDENKMDKLNIYQMLDDKHWSVALEASDNLCVLVHSFLIMQEHLKCQRWFMMDCLGFISQPVTCYSELVRDGWQSLHLLMNHKLMFLSQTTQAFMDQ